MKQSSTYYNPTLLPSLFNGPSKDAWLCLCENEQTYFYEKLKLPSGPIQTVVFIQKNCKIMETTAPVTIIAAMTKNRAIGYRGKLIYRLKEDLRNFKALTTNNVDALLNHYQVCFLTVSIIL